MKTKFFAAVALMSAFAFVSPAGAQGSTRNTNTSVSTNVRKLIETRECSGCNLSGANLQGAHLIGADLRNANLKGANLKNANLEGADLTGANLQSANLTSAFINSVSMNNANLTNANLTNAHFVSNDLDGATAVGVNWTGTEIYNVNIGIGGEY
ncbi:MAG: pentapeptide repeat-containing protein [Calothrix sp. FI2-JRJ7]|nr:pentapeptide repeat-containing protein [Calothrix sp. FI2-JRJ7]